MFSRLVHGPHHVIAKGDIRVLDVRAKEMADRVGLRECDETLHAAYERGCIAHVQPTRIEAVAGQENTGATIVDRDARGLMTGNRKHVHDAVAKIEDG